MTPIVTIEDIEDTILSVEDTELEYPLENNDRLNETIQLMLLEDIQFTKCEEEYLTPQVYK